MRFDGMQPAKFGAGALGSEGAIEAVRAWQARKRNPGSPGFVAVVILQ
jgi:hypothetical protein